MFMGLAFSACNHPEKNTAAIVSQDTIPVKVLPLAAEDLSRAIATSGQFTTNDETMLSFKNGGVINRIYVNEGDAVSKGQLLAAVNPTEISAQVAQINLSYQKAERDYDRASKLYKDSVATLEQMQNAKTAFEVAKQQLSAARFNQNYAEIRATRNGYVLKKLTSEGQMVGPGTPILQVNGAKQHGWILKVGLSDQQWAVLKLNDGASVTTDALPQQTLPARVTRKSEGIDPQSGTFSVELTLADAHIKGLATGLFGKATIVPTGVNKGYTIPYDALLDGGENEGYVFITNDRATVQKVKVQLGAIQQDKISIISGLKNARAIVVSGSAYLTNGSKIKIVN